MKQLKIEPLDIEGLDDIQNLDVADRIEELLESWAGTPYLPGQNIKGRGVDCVHFVSAIYDVLLGTNFNHTKLPQDASLHNKGATNANLHNFFRMYPCTRLEGDVVQPGDIVICGPVGANGGPGHGMIAGIKSLWHVDSRCVCRAGLSVMQRNTYAFKQIRRLDNRKIIQENL